MDKKREEGGEGLLFLYLVRHGQPDYETDTLTDIGREQAQLCANRMAVSQIDKIYSSPMGRAKETAKPLAELLHKEISIEPWSYELGEESKTLFPDGQMHTLSNISSLYFHQESIINKKLEDSFESTIGINQEGFVKRYQQICDGVDGFLEKCGYLRRKDGLYLEKQKNEERIALFCHCGMMRVIVSHFLQLPYQHLASSFFCNYTGITLFFFETRGGKLISPSLLSYGDTGHLFAENKAPQHYLMNENY